MADTNTITTADLARVREVEFVELFSENIEKLMQALGVARRIPKQAGSALKAYTAEGTLQDGAVGEGETIPLSKYTTKPVSYGSITLKKWRKSTTAEAIIERGYDQAVDAMTDRMLRDVQREIRADFFALLADGEGTASGSNLQGALAQAWGQLQVKFEDDDIDAAFFVNPLDAADYLSEAAVTMQSAFGMTYIENFLGLGTLILNSSVPRGKVYATAKENIVLYYIPVGGADLGEVFQFASDESGLIGIHEEPDYTNMTASSTVLCGISLFAERLDGVIVSSFGDAA
ncbi:MAG: hypothetical protein IJC71_01790 [Clostridia bacterium]|nr:hypothetical protein [Clostridia bacterium]